MYQYRLISLKEIFDTHLYDLHPFLKDSPVSKKLIEAVILSGILHPPTLQHNTKGGYDIICGRQRLKCSYSVLNHSQCFCRLLPLEANPEKVLTLLLEDQFSHGPLTIIEQSWFIDICKNCIPNPLALQFYLDSIPQDRITRGFSFLSPLKDLEDELQKKIHLSVISEKILGVLFRYEKQDQLILANLIDKMQLGKNNQRKLVGFITDILHQKDMTLSSLLTEKNIETILNHPKMNWPQKTTQLLGHLYTISQPLLNRAENSFQNEVESLLLPKQCTLENAPSFENDEVIFSIRFKNLQNFKSIWPSIANFVDH